MKPLIVLNTLMTLLRNIAWILFSLQVCYHYSCWLGVPMLIMFVFYYAHKAWSWVVEVHNY